VNTLSDFDVKACPILAELFAAREHIAQALKSDPGTPHHEADMIDARQRVKQAGDEVRKLLDAIPEL